MVLKTPPAFNLMPPVPNWAVKRPLCGTRPSYGVPPQSAQSLSQGRAEGEGRWQHGGRCSTSAHDAVDGSSTGTQVPLMWVLLELPRFGGANHASGYHHRSRHCQVGLSGARPLTESRHRARGGLGLTRTPSWFQWCAGSCGSPSRFTRFCTGFARCSANVFRL